MKSAEFTSYVNHVQLPKVGDHVKVSSGTPVCTRIKNYGRNNQKKNNGDFRFIFIVCKKQLYKLKALKFKCGEVRVIDKINFEDRIQSILLQLILPGYQ